MTDVVADCLSRIRNAVMAGHEEVKIPHSILKERLVELLVKEGYLKSSRVETAGSQAIKKIVAQIRYKANGEPRITSLKRISTPGQRVYRKAPDKMLVRSGLGFQILSTSRGIMTEREAMEKKVGGEVLAEVY